MISHNLPVQPTPFFSRSAELAEINSLLADSACRLLTLVGPGGIGKTRLALEAASRVVQTDAEYFPQGVYFVNLQPLDAPEQIISAIATALKLQFAPASDVQQELLDTLRDRSLLLILDNFEHLLEGVELLSDILATAPGVCLLVTSRERLNLREEWVLEVSGLAFPIHEGQHDIERYSAVQFFLGNAQRAQVGFHLNEAQKPAIAHICRLVSGMPLAIELAAAWVRVMPCEQIATEIERSLDVLETPARNVQPRHRNMRAVFEPTWSRLPQVEQDVFMRLSVFRGSFTREAVQAVTGATLSVLSALVDKSLLKVDADGRYTIHELMRQYGAEQLAQSGSEAETRDAHSTFYSDWLHRLEPDVKGRRQLAALNEMEADFENIRTAWYWALERKIYHSLDLALKSLFHFCEMRGHIQEGREFLGAAQVQLETDSSLKPIWGRVLVHNLWMLHYGSDSVELDETIRGQIEEALTIARQQGDKAQTAFCHWLLGALRHGTKDAAAGIPFLEESLALFTELDDRFYMGRAADWLAGVWGFIGNQEKFITISEQSLLWRRAIGDRFGTTASLMNLMQGAVETGQYEKAKRYNLEMEETYREIGGESWIIRQIAHLSFITFCQGDFQKTREQAEEVQRLLSKSDLALAKATGQEIALAMLGMLAALEEDYARSWQFCEGVASQLPHHFYVVEECLAVAACGLEDLSTAQLYFSVALKQSVLFKDQRGMTAALPVAAILLTHEDRKEQAAELLGRAFQHPASAKAWLEQWPLLTRLRTQLEAELGSEVYGRAWERGQHSDLEVVAGGILRHFQSDEPQQAVQTSNSRLVDPLTERELEVLNAIAGGSSNAAIAEQMVVEVSTVKKHLNHIYDKLGVQSRTQAIARGREIGLL